MKKEIICGLALVLLGLSSTAQQPVAEKPVKTGNEWKMPGDVIKRSHYFADSLRKKLSLDEVTTKKVFDTYLANTKPVDEIIVTEQDEKARKEKLKANHDAFNDKLKNILSAEQFRKYIQGDAKGKS